jgi:hypothetical protein
MGELFARRNPPSPTLPFVVEGFFRFGFRHWVI